MKLTHTDIEITLIALEFLISICTEKLQYHDKANKYFEEYITAASKMKEKILDSLVD